MMKWKGSGHALLKELSQQLHEVADGNHNILKIAGFRAENPCRPPDCEAGTPVTTPQRMFQTVGVYNVLL
jgi:hypothetical protein